MPLNVPYSHPIVPIVMYDPAMPPMLPPIAVPPQVQSIVPMVAVELINQLNLRATASPVRTAGYNLAVLNNFMNDEFRELLQLACQYCELKYKKGYIRTPAEGIQESVRDILSMWLSNLVMIHPELKSACSPQIVNAAYQNAPVFQNLKVELQAMMNQTPQQQPWGQPQQPQWNQPNQYQGNQVMQPQQQQWGQPQQPGGWGPQPGMQAPPQQQWGQPQQLPPGQWVTNQYGQQVFVPQQMQQPMPPQGGWGPQPGMQAPQQQGWGQPQQQWGGGNNFQYQRPVVGDPRMGGGYQQPNVVEASNMAKDAALQSRFMGQLDRYNQPNQQQVQQPMQQPVQQAPQYVDNNPRWGQPAQQPVQQPVQQMQPQQPYQQPEPPVVQAVEEQPFKFKELKIVGGSEMDRQNHAVAYFGEEVTYGVKERQEVFSKSADELSKASAAPLDLPDGVEPEVNDSGVQVASTLHYDITEEALLLEAKMKYLQARDGETPSPMFRIFGKVASPFVGRKVLSNLSSNLRSVNSLTKLAERMKIKMKEALTGKGGLRSPDDLDTIAYLNYLDAYFTKRVNNILNNSLRADVKIGSFTTDVGDLSEFLRTKRGMAISYAWDECANNLFLRYIEGFDSALESTIEANFQVPESQCMVLTPTTFSFTFTELTLTELGFVFTDDPVAINKDKAPALYKIAASLAKHKKELETDTDIDYLVTSDGAKYIIYKNYTVTGENYLISQAQ